MKNQLLIVAAIAAFSVAGCQDKPKDMQSAAPQGGIASKQIPAAPGGNNSQNPAGASHKGKVVSVMDAAGFPYFEVEEKGQKLWVASMRKTKVSIGDEVEFPDSPPMMNLKSKKLKRTFDKIIFTSALRVNGK